MYAAGPRVERQFLERTARLDDASESMAETYRRTRELATQMGIPRPSYELVRIHLRAVRRRELERMAVRELVLQLAFSTRSADTVLADLLDLIE